MPIPMTIGVYFRILNEQSQLAEQVNAASSASPDDISTLVICQDRSEEHTSNSSHLGISYAVFCLKKKKKERPRTANYRSPYMTPNATSMSTQDDGSSRKRNADTITSSRITAPRLPAPPAALSRCNC